MKNINWIFYFIIVLSFITMSFKQLKLDRNNKRYLSAETNGVHKIGDTRTDEKVNQKYFHGSGSEPAWIIILSKNETGSMEYDLAMNYGADTHKGIANKISKIDSINYEIYQLKCETVDILIKITNKTCIDEGDYKHTNEVVLTYDNSSYFGCGDYK